MAFDTGRWVEISEKIHRAGDFRRVRAKNKPGDSIWHVRQLGRSGVIGASWGR